jgi:hypothetical protein
MGRSRLAMLGGNLRCVRIFPFLLPFLLVFLEHWKDSLSVEADVSSSLSLSLSFAPFLFMSLLSFPPLQSHPNTRFADLALLAEVVSRGPSHTALSPSSAPSSSPFFATSTSTPLASSSRARSPSPAPPDANDDGKAHAEAVVAAANARHHARRIQVDEERVREALRMLDARSFSSASGGGSGLVGGAAISVGEGGVGLPYALVREGGGWVSRY